MSKYFKVGIVLVFVIVTIFGHTNSVKAIRDIELTQLETTNIKKVRVKELPMEASFDLTKNEKQEVSYINDHGEEVTFGIEPILEDDYNTSDYSLACINNCSSPISKGNSTFRIYTYTGAVNISYRIKVNRTGNNAKITDAYDLSVTLIGYTESNRYFDFDDKLAEYSATITLFGVFPIQMSIWLKAEINGTNLITRAKA